METFRFYNIYLSKILFLSVFLPTIITQSLIFEINLNSYEIPSIVINLGSPPQPISFYLSTIKPNLYVIHKKLDNSGYDPNISTTIDYMSAERFLPDLGSEIRGREVSEIISINTEMISLQIPKFHLFVITDGSVSYYHKGSLGLEFMLEEDQIKTSVIEELYKLSLIKEKIFYVTKHEKYPLSLVLGKYPKKYNDPKIFKKCSAVTHTKKGDLNPLWQCKLNAIYFDDLTFFEIQSNIAISLGGNVMCVNNEIYQYIKNRFFSQEIQNNRCSEDFQDSQTLIKCNNSVEIGEEANINLVFEKWSIKINLTNQFTPGFFNKLFNFIRCDPIKWSIGYKLLNKYDIVFDKKLKQIGFGLY